MEPGSRHIGRNSLNLKTTISNVTRHSAPNSTVRRFRVTNLMMPFALLLLNLSSINLLSLL